MRRRGPAKISGVLVYFIVFTSTVIGFARDARLSLRLSPREAYVFIDGLALGEGGGWFRLSPGSHKVEIYNYGYQPETRTVSIARGQRLGLSVALQPVSGTVNGPWACITINGAPHAAVLLNGKTPEFFVGHGDEFDNEWVWKQELLVPPGKHQVTLLDGSQTVWSGTVEVAANQRAIVNAHKANAVRIVNWARGARLQSLPRFRAGIASATVAVGPGVAQFSANPTSIACGQSSQLTWTGNGILNTQIAEIGNVPASGQQTVQPKQTTTYKLTASGTGGVSELSATVNVNKAVQASLQVSPAEIRYRRVGEKVEEQGAATLAWNVSNANSVSVDPLGAVDASGQRAIQATPKKTDLGPVDETVTYKLTATNACGGTEEQVAKLHIVGSIDPLPRATPTIQETTLEAKLAMNSIYFPTGVPTLREPAGGLVRSQQRRLTEVASDFRNYLNLRSNAHLILQAHADQRGSSQFNLALSQRRAGSVRNFLIKNGVPEGSIEMRALGKEQNLSGDEVRELTRQNPNISARDRGKVIANLPTFLLANNRRVDLVLSTTGQKSTRFFPYNAEDLRILLGEKVMGPRPVARGGARKQALARRR